MQNSLFQQFLQQRDNLPEKPCLIDATSEYSYDAACRLIEQIRSAVMAIGIDPDDSVAVYSEKNALSVLTFLALSSLDLNIVTLDKAFPPALLEFILLDSRVKLILGDTPLPITASIPSFLFDQITAKAPAALPRPQLNDRSAASKWIVYSSGTTGKPKGIVISQAAIVNSQANRHMLVDNQVKDRVACCIYFYWEALRPLLKGATVFIIPDHQLLDLNYYCQFIANNAINETLWTPSFAQMLLQHADDNMLRQLGCLEKVWLNGEVVGRYLADKVLAKLPGVSFFNLYSISETIDVSARLITANTISGDGFASTGTPLPNNRLYVLDEKEQPCQPGQKGELYVHSNSLAECYLNEATLTAASFKEIAVNGTKQRLFKTKDTAIQKENGEIFILGRNDNIVKIRGYNVSLLAIEDTLKRHLPIENCILSVEENDSAGQTLVASLQCSNPEKFMRDYAIDPELGTSGKMKQILSNLLPHYAHPAYYVCTDKLQMNQYATKTIRQKAAKISRVDTLSHPLAILWHEILQVPVQSIGTDSDFFELGGNSLLAVDLVQQFNQRFSASISIAMVYNQPDFDSQSRWLGENPATLNQDRDLIEKDMGCNFSNTPETIPPCSNLYEASHILITGTTGFLGSHWLAACLQNTSAHYYCLVRAPDAQSGYQRLLQIFQQYQLDTTLLDNRITIVPGDLSCRQFGMDDKQWHSLGHSIDYILHAASQVNLLLPYSQLRDSSVTGTRTLIQLALQTRYKPLIHISSNAVVPPDKSDYNCFLDAQSYQHLNYGYAQAKWVQEYLLQKAVDNCRLPVTVIRLGNLAPAQSGYGINPHDANGMLLSFIHHHQKIPARTLLEFCPVDRIIDQIGRIITATPSGEVIDLHGQNLLPAEALKNLFPDWRLTSLDAAAWAEYLAEHSPALQALWQVDGLFTGHYERPPLIKSLQTSPEETQALLLKMTALPSNRKKRDIA